MRRIVILAAIASSITGCARVELAPSHLGLPVVSDADADEAVGDETGPPPQLKYVTSTKVLGAMAYHKVTGRAIDPSRLQGSR